MHIKNVEITGFKSYGSRKLVELDPGINVIVGENGKGKSNVYDAIRFVLGDQFGNLRAAQSLDLLNEGVSARAPQASVYITFDNSDGRLPVEGAEVVVGRVVGIKKDEYFVGGKVVKKGDVASLLDSAGFSRSNPYYIVAQGKVQALTRMSDADRLNLLKEVAGTQVYEERRRESLSILEDTDGKRRGIDEVLAHIDARIGELEGEVEELQAYSRLDRRRRALEYTLHSNELAKAEGTLAEIEEGRETEGAAAEKLRGDVEAAEGAVSGLEATLKGLQAQLRQLEAEKREASEALPRLSKARVKAAARVAELEGRVASHEGTQAGLVKQAAELQARLDALRGRLEGTLIPALAAATKAYDALKGAAGGVQARMDALYEKQGRSGKFKSRKERDAYLNGLLADVRAQAAAKRKVIAAGEAEAAALEAKAAAAGARAATLEAAGRAASDSLKAKDSELDRALEARNEALARRQEVLKGLDDARAAADKSKEEAAREERALHAATPPPIRQGLAAVQRMQGGGRIAGIHGPLIDLFKPSHPRYNAACDVVAGNQLWNVVVEDEHVAEAVVASLVKEKAGRVTLMPLSRLSSPPVAYPTDNDCRPLMSFLAYDKKHEAAVAQVFSRVLLCRNLEVAAKYAKAAGLTCVTLEGDLVNRKGGIQGGYIDHAAVRLVHCGRYYEAAAAEAEARKRVAELDASRVRVDAENTQLRGVEERLTREKAELRATAGRSAADAERARGEADACRREAERRRGEVAEAGAALAGLVGRQGGLEAEVASELASALTAAEEGELETLGRQGDELQAQLRAAGKAMERAREARVAAETELSENVERRLREVRGQLSAAAGGTARADIAGELADELKAARVAAAAAAEAEAAASESLARAEASLSKAGEAASGQRASLDKARATLSAAREALEAETLSAERGMEARRQALRKKEECTLRLREVGALPAAELEEVAGWKRRELVQELTRVNDGLSKLPGVNKKAADQYTSFAAQREALQQRKGELDEGDASIRALIRSLDAKKDEAILRTFDGVTRHFSSVFRELVPKGKGSLHLLTELDEKLAAAAAAGDSEREEEELNEAGEEEGEEEEDSDAASAAGSEPERGSAKRKGGKGTGSKGRKSAGSKGKKKGAAADSDEDEEADEEEAESSEDEDAGFSRKKKGGKGKGKGAAATAASKAGKRGKGRKAVASAVSAAAGSIDGLSVRDLRKRLDTFRGVQVRVSFTDGAPVKSMSLLSGGQKTLVALALIFAIQRTDPAPFYLFDEADGALDQVYRSTVAALLRRTASAAENPAQVILTTFSPELASVGNRFFAVSMSDATKQGDIKATGKDAALRFIQTHEAQEAARRAGGAAAAGAGAGAGAGGASASRLSSASRSSIAAGSVSRGAYSSGAESDAEGGAGGSTGGRSSLGSAGGAGRGAGGSRVSKRPRLDRVPEGPSEEDDEDDEEEAEEEEEEAEEEEAPAPRKAAARGKAAATKGAGRRAAVVRSSLHVEGEEEE